MAIERKALAWSEVDVDSLTDDQRAKYDAYKAAYRVAKAKKEEFEAFMQEIAPEGKRLVFGYNFGKLSVAIDDAQAAKPKASAKAVPLSQLIARR